MDGASRPFINPAIYKATASPPRFAPKMNGFEIGMSNTLLFILRAADLDTATIPPAIRLAKEPSIRETIPEHEAPKAARVSGKVWDKIRPQLAELFHFSAGKVTLLPDTGIDAFDL